MLLAALTAALLGSTCPANAANQLRPASDGSQLITVDAASVRTTYAILGTWERSGPCWQAVGRPFRARVGRNGLRETRREGDGTTPIGVFPIGRVMYGIEPNPGVKFRYHRIRCGDWWVEDPASPAYNRFRHVACGHTPPFKTTTPDMSESARAYAHLAVVEFNMHPVVAGRGSGIFLHAQTGRATNGCISLGKRDLVRVLRWLRPSAAPSIAVTVLGHRG